MPPDYSLPLEQLWQETENALPAAISAAVNGSLFADPASLAVLRRLICLHVVRSLHNLLIWRRILDENAKQGRLDTLLDWYANDRFIAGLFKDHTGLEPAGPDALAAERERMVERLTKSMDAARIENLVQNYDRVHDEFVEPAGLEVGHALEGELILGDSPAVTWDSETGRVGLAGGAALRTSDTLTMPLTPHLLLAVGGDNRYVSLDAAAVDRANTLQLLGAVHRVFARPIADVVEFIDVQRRARLGARLQETEETRSDD